SNNQDIEPEMLDNQDIELEMLDNQDIGSEVLDSQDVEFETPNCQDENMELEVLAAYNSTDDLSDTDSIRIGGGERINTETQQVTKWTYLCHHAGKPAENSITTFNNEHVGHELSLLVSRFDLMLRKLPKNIVEEIRFLTVIAKANATIQYRIIKEKYNVRIHRPDLYTTIQMFQNDSAPGKDDAAMLLRRLNEKKIEDPR
ncbi:7294_t:CDS:2, partial [Racocetra fulgida]